MENKENVVNDLLIDMAKNQKESSKNLVKLFVVIIVCYTLVLITMIVGFFVYESQFDVIDTGYGYEYEYDYEQEAQSGDNGTAIVNGNGEVNYGTSKVEDENSN